MSPGTGQAPEAEPVPSRPVSPTGHARVDAVLERTEELDRLPVAEHPGRYEELHAALVAELDAELDAEPGALPAGPAPERTPGREQVVQGRDEP